MTNLTGEGVLMSPEEAGQMLLEAVTLQAARTNGVSGLRPVRVGRRLMFRPADVDGLVRQLYASLGVLACSTAKGLDEPRT